MSMFTNPPDRTRDQAQAYVSAVLDLLGARDPVATLDATPALLTSIVASTPATSLKQPEAPTRWSIAQVVHHLADAELVFANRLRTALTEERPEIRGFDQDAWCSRFAYAEADLEPALELFHAVRKSNLRIARSLTPEDMTREVMHAERGLESVDRMMRLYAGHDLLHLKQIDRIQAAVRSRES